MTEAREDAVPMGLARAASRAEGAELAAGAVAFQNVLKIEEPYERRAGLWEPDVRTPTRLGDARLIFRLARSRTAKSFPWRRDRSCASLGALRSFGADQPAERSAGASRS